MNWNWAEWTLAGMLLFNVAASGFIHGKPQRPWNGFTIVVRAALTAALLWFAGVWK